MLPVNEYLLEGWLEVTNLALLAVGFDEGMRTVIAEMTSHIMGGVECIPIDSMTVESFQSTYGRTFSSHCGLYDSYVGYEIFFY